MKWIMVVIWFTAIVLAEVGKWYAASALLRIFGVMK